MNIPVLIYVLGQVCKIEAALMLLPVVCALCYREYPVAGVYLIVSAICLVIGLIMTARKPKYNKIRTREGMAATGLSWILMSILGCLPFILLGEIPNFIDAFFETVSGFTTTGSTIIQDLDAISYGSRFWRSFTHWIGGMGVLVFLIALLPGTSGSFMNLMIAESPGPEVSKLVPKVRDSAKMLYQMYIALTLIEIILLLMAGMPLFDSLTLSFGTAGTGGFAVRSSGFADYSILQQGIIAVFMMLFGINFGFYFLILSGKWKKALHMEEVITYLGIIVSVVTIITISVRSLFPNLFLTIHNVFFTVSSIITTTGYTTVDFNLWTPLAKTLLVLIMFIGACAGSTGGGIKVSRINVMFKGIRKEFRTLLHPGLVAKVRMDDEPIAHETVRSINVFLSIYVVLCGCFRLLSAADHFGWQRSGHQLHCGDRHFEQHRTWSGRSRSDEHVRVVLSLFQTGLLVCDAGRSSGTAADLAFVCGADVEGQCQDQSQAVRKSGKQEYEEQSLNGFRLLIRKLSGLLIKISGLFSARDSDCAGQES